jgi:hypothetical protein
MSAVQASRPGPRLNPFAFPSDTDFRFVLLLVTVMSACLVLYNGIYLDFGGGGKVLIETVKKCAPLAPQYTAEDLTNPLADPSEKVRQNEIFQRCSAGQARTNALWMIGGVVLMLGVTAGLYWAYPPWKIRRDRLLPVPAEDLPELAAYLDELCVEAGVAPKPTFLVNPLVATASGLAFGRAGKYHVVLMGGLVGQFFRDRASFRAVVLHELAHLRNADIDKTYLTIAIWYAFLLTSLLPFALTLIGAPLGFVLSHGWRVVALGLLVYLTRNAVLRAREMYADVKASVWDGPSGSLARMLEHLPVVDRGWRALTRSHPDARLRRRTLSDTRHLFEIGKWEAVGTGIAAMLAFLGVFSLTAKIAQGRNSSTLAPLLAGAVIAPLVAAILGLGLWRGTFANLTCGGRQQGVARLALGLVTGALLGRVLAIEFALTTSDSSSTWGIATFVFAHIIWAALLLLVVTIILRWIVSGASVWLEVAAAMRTPRPIYLAGLVLAAGMMVLCFSVLFPAIQFISLPPPGSSTSELVMASTMPLMMITMLLFVLSPVFTLLALVSIWAFPFAAMYSPRRDPVTAGSPWAFLGATTVPWNILPQPPLTPRMALRMGLVAGVACAGSLILLRVAWRLEFDEATRALDATKLRLYFSMIALAVVAQSAAAAIAARRALRLPVIHGAFAAFVTGVVAAVAILVTNLAVGGSADAAFVWDTFRFTLHFGVLPALAAAGLASRRRRAPPTSSNAPAGLAPA